MANDRKESLMGETEGFSPLGTEKGTLRWVIFYPSISMSFLLSFSPSIRRSILSFYLSVGVYKRVSVCLVTVTKYKIEFYIMLFLCDKILFCLFCYCFMVDDSIDTHRLREKIRLT